MSGTGRSEVADRSHVTDSTNSRGKAIHHGSTPAAWVGSLTAMVAVLIGGFAVVFQNWVVFTIAAVLLALAGVATVVLQKTGHGAR